MVHCLVRNSADAAPVKDKLLWLRHILCSAFHEHPAMGKHKSYKTNQQKLKRKERTGILTNMKDRKILISLVRAH